MFLIWHILQKSTQKKFWEVWETAGIDELSITLRNGSQVFSKPLSELCNLSIKLRSFFDSCKIANLKPLSKRGFKTNTSNYISLLLLPLISKIIKEKLSMNIQVVFYLTMAFYKTFNLDFDKNNSTDSFLTFFHDKFLKSFDKGLMTGMIHFASKTEIKTGIDDWHD